MAKFKTLVYIGRFSPFHNGHLETVKQASQLCDELIIIVGSSHGPRTLKNPWTFAERVEFIVRSFNDISTGSEGFHSGCQIDYVSAVDYLYNDTRWAQQIQDIVSRYNKDDSSIGIIGYEKDNSSFYLNMFPQWTKYFVGAVGKNGNIINGTDIRKAFFNYEINKCSELLPNTVYTSLYEHANDQSFKELRNERDYISEYKHLFSKCPYPPIFVTTDAIVTQSGHVLMVKRRALPGKGLWALPGGFVNANTDASLIDAMIRELREETKLKVPVPVLKGSIVNNRVFDAIDRSARGRTITHAYHIKLPDGELPIVKGSDDAEKAKFIPLNDVDRTKCFEDHYEIISFFTGI